jgi:hypothetical protein
MVTKPALRNAWMGQEPAGWRGATHEFLDGSPQPVKIIILTFSLQLPGTEAYSFHGLSSGALYLCCHSVLSDCASFFGR